MVANVSTFCSEYATLDRTLVFVCFSGCIKRYVERQEQPQSIGALSTICIAWQLASAQVTNVSFAIVG